MPFQGSETKVTRDLSTLVSGMTQPTPLYRAFSQTSKDKGRRTKDDPGHQSIFCSNLSNYSAAIQFKLLPSFAAARPQIACFTLDVFTVVVWQEWASQLLNAYTRPKNILHSFSILRNI